jgi:CubicO group peptidase (beta-lactamase class C family)
MTAMKDWSSGAEEAIQDALEEHIADGSVPGLVWLASRGDDVIGGVAGVMAEGGPSMRRDAIFRVASITKPVTAVAALSAVEAGMFGLDDAVERWLPEMADRRVVRRSEGPLDDTVPADRPITVRDLLTFTSGYGYDFTNFEGQAQIAELIRLDLGFGPPAPARSRTVEDWMARLGTIPLDHQPGAAWRYHLSAELLGVLLARAEGEPLEAVLRRRVLAPTGMVDTAFSIERSDLERMTTSYVIDEETGARREYDPPDGQWAAPPRFPSGGGGLVSTADDFLAFGTMLRNGGEGAVARVLSAESVAAMATDQIPDLPAISADGATGWGFGVDVQRTAGAGPRSPGSYGWVGGLGTVWMNDPVEDLVGVLLTNQALTSPEMTGVMTDFWEAVYDNLGDD